LLDGSQEKEILEHKEQNMKLKITALAASLSVFALGLNAQTPTAVADDSPEGMFVKLGKKGKDGKAVTMKIGGYVDAYYAKSTAADADARPSGTQWGGGTAQTGRIFEKASDQFSLGLAQAKLEIGNEDWEVVADLMFGPNAEQTSFNNFGSTGNSITSTSIKQAYVGAYLMKNLKLTAGQFGTHVGYEVVESYQNANYMLGYLFGYGPFYHTGAKLDYSLLDGKIGLMAGVVNGWDLMVDNNKDKSAIGQISIKPNDALAIFINYVGGNETGALASAGGNAVGAVGGMRHIGDLVVTYQVNKMIKVGLNVVYGEEKACNDGGPTCAAKTWGGAAGYISVTPINMLTLSYRADYYDDRKGARGFGTQVLGHTLTGTISMYDGHFLIRPEVKYDKTQDDYFGIAGNLKKDSITMLIAFTGVY
jgi:hypothetical protein